MLKQFWELMGPAALASIIMSPVHCLFGLHIVRRGVIFIDLAVAQIASLGAVVAVLRGHEVASNEAYWTSLAFALVGALLIALSRFKLGRVPHEAMIGIFFVVASAASLIALEGTAHGVEELRDTLTGNLLFVEMDHVKWTAIVYGIVLAVLVLSWRSVTAVSERLTNAPTGARGVALDFLFYGLLGFVVASSVQVAGILQVFTWLVMPGATVFFWVRRMDIAVYWSLPISIVASIGGLLVSYWLDWPTGAAMVVTMGAVVALSYMLRLLVPMRPEPEPASADS